MTTWIETGGAFFALLVITIPFLVPGFSVHFWLLSRLDPMARQKLRKVVTCLIVSAALAFLGAAGLIHFVDPESFDPLLAALICMTGTHLLLIPAITYAFGFWHRKNKKAV